MQFALSRFVKIVNKASHTGQNWTFMNIYAANFQKKNQIKTNFTPKIFDS